jgi:hypothetical protein
MGGGLYCLLTWAKITGMFLLILCVGLWALMATKAPIDVFGWLMLVATAWFMGVLDSGLMRKWDKRHQRVLTEENLNEDKTPLF